MGGGLWNHSPTSTSSCYVLEMCFQCARDPRDQSSLWDNRDPAPSKHAAFPQPLPIITRWVRAPLGPIGGCGLCGRLLQASLYRKHSAQMSWQYQHRKRRRLKWDCSYLQLSQCCSLSLQEAFKRSVKHLAYVCNTRTFLWWALKSEKASFRPSQV